MEGLNVRVNVLARSQLADDSVGGSVRVDNARYTNVRARISNMPVPSVLAQQGVQGEDLHKIILYPDRYPAVEREDIVVPTRGRWNGARFRVVEVRPSSVLDGRTRAHIQLTCSRVRYANENTPENAFAPTPYDPVVTLAANMDAANTTASYTSIGDPIAVGDIIQIDLELMVVSVVVPATNNLLVIRAWQSTAAAHVIGAAIERAPS